MCRSVKQNEGHIYDYEVENEVSRVMDRAFWRHNRPKSHSRSTPLLPLGPNFIGVVHILLMRMSMTGVSTYVRNV